MAAVDPRQAVLDVPQPQVERLAAGARGGSHQPPNRPTSLARRSAARSSAARRKSSRETAWYGFGWRCSSSSTRFRISEDASADAPEAHVARRASAQMIGGDSPE